MVSPNNQNPPSGTPLFPIGRSFVTPGALDALSDAGADAADLFLRHQHGDWGTVCEEDRRANDVAARNGERVISAYVLDSGVEVWVVTEADRSSCAPRTSTITLPEEY